ncbi:MAG TPA: hydrogenase maturation protease [Sulfurovum sp.]|nr:hydrogenase maturation protease [Sulfurovum sp.]
MKILIMGIGNVLFGDEGVGAHMANLLQEKYQFISDEHQVDVLDGGTLAQRLIPIITDGYERVVLIDCVNVDDANIGDVYCFDFNKVPDYITWNGSAHEVEMLQTLQMTELMGDLPPVKIVGVVPYVIGEDSTFSMTDEVVNATLVMEKTIIDYIESFGIEVKIKKELQIRDVSEQTYIKGFDACY